MPQFDVHRLRSGEALVVDCQSDLLEASNTRFVVPLLPRRSVPTPLPRLNPVFIIDGDEMVLATQFMAAVYTRELGETVASLRERAFEVLGAIDVLISGV